MKLKNLPAGSYTHISSTYLSILDGGGWSCENCGRLIANLVTVKHEGGKTYIIGQDCAKTLFSDVENKGIDKAIKAEKTRQKYEARAKEQQGRTERLNEFLSECRKAGITNDNINTPEARQKRNSILDVLEAKHGTQITYRV